MTCSTTILLTLGLLLHTVYAGPETVILQETDYSFEDFEAAYDRNYRTDERDHRRSIFQANLKTIVSHNQNPNREYTLGVNQFVDRLPSEWHLGYANIEKEPKRVSSRSIEDLIEVEPVQDLPKQVDWRLKGVTTPVKNQGMCGSCWAFASTAVLESHVAIATNTLFTLSTQELVSCANNTYHCGGDGGCMGATAEIAFDLVQRFGVVAEDEFGYQDAHGRPVPCRLRKSKEYYQNAVATIEQPLVLPSNNYTVLMNVVAKLGPATVSVACSPWVLYQSGVFHAPFSVPKATDVNHLVVVEGYGVDPDTGVEYWLVRNSWGPLWGESGYIRLKRVGDQECGTDKSPEDGTACTIDEDGNKLTPPPAKICGNSGILFDSAIPLGPSLIKKEASFLRAETA